MPQQKLFPHVRAEMTRNQFGQRELACRLGMSVTGLNERLTGKKVWETELAYSLLDLFDVPHDQFHVFFPPLPKVATTKRKAS